MVRTDTRLLRYFVAMMRNATVEDWIWIYHFEEIQKKVMFYNEDEEKCIPVDEAEFTIPWPMVLLCGRHHTKHIFVCKRHPPAEILSRDLKNFRNRVAWKWHFRKDATPLPSIYVECKNHVVPYTEKLPKTLNSWIDGLRHEVMTKAEEMRTLGKHRWRSNMIPIIKYGIKLFKQYKIVAVKNDKDPGFTLMTREQYDEAFAGVFEMRASHEPIYVRWGGMQRKEDDERRLYIQLAKKVEELEDEDGLKRAICRSLSLPRATRVARMDITCKSHKPTVAFRPLHTATNYAYKGLSIWLSQKIRSYLRKFDYLLKDSAFLVKDLESLDVWPTYVIVKLDIKDFFLSGNHQDLDRDTKCIFRGTERYVFSKVVSFLLSSQAVQHPYSGDCYAIVTGTGMGLTHSGELADLALHSKVERHFVLDPGCREKHGIVRYYRFKDDAIAILRSTDYIADFVKEYSRRAGYYKVEVEDVNRFWTRYLDVTVMRSGRKFIVKPAFKETTLNSIPLSVCSCHPPSVHDSWPVAVLRGFASKSSNVDIRERARDTFISRFTKHHHCQKVVDRLRSFCFDVGDRVGMRVGREKMPIKNLWLTLAYHPVLYACIRKVISRYMSSSQNCLLLSQAFDDPKMVMRVRPAWYNADPPLSMTLRSLRARMDDESETTVYGVSSAWL